MTSANVSKMTSAMSFQTNAASKSSKEEQNAADFMAMFGSLAANCQNTVQSSTKETAVSTGQDTSRAAYEKYPVKEDQIPEASKGLDEAQLEQVQETVEEFSGEVKEKIEELFGVTKEQIEKAMEELGLTAADLMNPTGLANLLTKLTGEEDGLGLLLNEDFQQLMQDVEILSEGLLQKLGMSKEDATELMEQIRQQTVELTEQTDASPQVQESEKIVPDIVNENVRQEAVAEENVLVSEKEITKKELPQEEVLQKEVQTSEDSQDETIVKTVVLSEKGEAEGEMPKEGSKENVLEDAGKNLLSEKDHANESKIQFGENVMNHVQTARAGENVAVNPNMTPQTTSVDVADIIRQVSEFTRIMYQGNETSMEMQLNPEHLGKVFVQISSKEGIITAQIAAQTEAAKEALESQVAVLKENMNQQGLKVEAVEVTIASHEFERNLEENQQNRGQEEQKEQTAKQNRRGISLNQLDELSGLMSEEEIMAAKMMRDNGNSVDFTA